MSGEIQITATFDQDSKRYHRFKINESEGITGAIYIAKGNQIPQTVTVKLRTKADKDQDNKGE